MNCILRRQCSQKVQTGSFFVREGFFLIKQNLKFLNETFDVPNTFNKGSWI
jgi:hypothetical protein